MKSNEMEQFFELVDTANEALVGKPMSDRARELAFRILREYDLDLIAEAVERHLRVSEYRLTPAAIIAQITGTMPSNDELVGMSRQRDTIIGVKAASLVGWSEIKSMDDYKLEKRLKANRYRLQRFVAAAQHGKYSEVELKRIKKANLDAAGALAPTVPGPWPRYREAVRARMAMLPMPAGELESPTDALSPEERSTARAHLKKLMKQWQTGG